MDAYSCSEREILDACSDEIKEILINKSLSWRWSSRDIRIDDIVARKQTGLPDARKILSVVIKTMTWKWKWFEATCRMMIGGNQF